MKKENKHRNHHKIRGNTDCFKNTVFETTFNMLYKGPLFMNDLITFRNLGKDMFGQRMNLAAKMCHAYVPINQQSLKILLDFLDSQENCPNASKFIDCFFASYNDESHDLIINKPNYVTTSKLKAVKHGIKDCFKAFDVYFQPIQNRIEYEHMASICDSDLVGKYKDIRSSLAFALNYLRELLLGKLPPKLTKNTFEQGVKLCSNLSSYYEYDKLIDKYILLKEKNNSYYVVSQECATYLICHKHK